MLYYLCFQKSLWISNKVIEGFIFNNDFLTFDNLTIHDIFLSLISTIFGFYLLLILLILKETHLPIWVIRKIVHLLGGSYIAFITFQYHKITGILFTISLFIAVFLVLVFFSKGKLIREYFTLDFRKGERKNSFLINTTFTLITLFISLIIFANYPAVFTSGVLVLAWADPFGEIFGRIYPIKEFKLVNKKSITGVIAVFTLSCLSFIITLHLFNIPYNGIDISIIIAGSLFCMFVEAMSYRWLDNIFLPIMGNMVMLLIIFC